MTLGLKARLLRVVLIFYERLCYQDEANNALFERPIQRIELASLVGARPESISQLVWSLEEEGLLKFNRPRARITDMEASLREACVLY